MSVPFIIEISEYNNDWPQLYLRELYEVMSLLGQEDIVDIQHFGSTAVQGLASKPIVDIMVGFRSFADALKSIPLLDALGYEYVEGVSVPGGRLFLKKSPRTHHLHLVQYGTSHWREPIEFRDYLRTHLSARQAYERLKRTNAELYRDDPPRYGREKTAFVETILRRAAHLQGLYEGV